MLGKVGGNVKMQGLVAGTENIVLASQVMAMCKLMQQLNYPKTPPALPTFHNFRQVHLAWALPQRMDRKTECFR